MSIPSLTKRCSSAFVRGSGTALVPHMSRVKDCSRAVLDGSIWSGVDSILSLLERRKLISTGKLEPVIPDQLRTFSFGSRTLGSSGLEIFWRVSICSVLNVVFVLVKDNPSRDGVARTFDELIIGNDSVNERERP
jgi:hypothetical protein